MRKKRRYPGLDVHAETICAAIAEPDGSVRELGTIRHRLEALRKLLTKLGHWSERGKPPLAVATVIGRELLRFIWAIGQIVEPEPADLGTRMSA